MSNQELEKNLIQRVCVGDILTRAAAQYPQRLALQDGDVCFTYRELNQIVNQCGHGLLALGLESQQRVAILSRNIWEFIVIYFACAKAGLIAVPLNPSLKSGELEYCLRDSGASVLIAESTFDSNIAIIVSNLPDMHHIIWLRSQGNVSDIPRSFGTFAELLASGKTTEIEQIVNDRDAIQLLYTSGTTAAPKGVLTSHVAVTITALSASLRNKLDETDVVLHVLPLFHCAQLNSLVLPIFVSGGSSVLISSFDPVLVAKLVETKGVTLLFLLPIMYQALLTHSETQMQNFSSVRLAVYAMAPMPSSRMKAIANRFPNAKVLLGSGQTEFTPPTTFQREEHQYTKAASWGTATPSVQVEIMDDEGQLLPRGQSGEIVYRGPQAMQMYWNLPDQTNQAFLYGWFHSGDIGYMDDEGVIWFTDRKKDIVKTGGENVSSIEIERRILEHFAVQEVSVLGLPHERWGEAVTAMVILKPGTQLTEQELISFCKETLSEFKTPKRILFVEDFPRTATGKIQKHTLRKAHANLYQATS